ncbi:hypothetical protein J6590_053988 [Homalodisca vitripennis]|nr:hypothetical protein J6590_053988 [Homalodisca vitripennis]
MGTAQFQGFKARKIYGKLVHQSESALIFYYPLYTGKLMPELEYHASCIIPNGGLLKRLLCRVQAEDRALSGPLSPPAPIYIEIGPAGPPGPPGRAATCRSKLTGTIKAATATSVRFTDAHSRVRVQTGYKFCPLKICPFTYRWFIPVTEPCSKLISDFYCYLWPSVRQRKSDCRVFRLAPINRSSDTVPSV